MRGVGCIEYLFDMFYMIDWDYNCEGLMYFWSSIMCIGYIFDNYIIIYSGCDFS